MKLNEKTGLYENYGAWHIPFWQTYEFKLFIGIFIAILLFLMIIICVKKYREYRKRKKLPIWNQIILELTTLKRKNKVNVDYGKEFYITASFLLKRYLSDRFGYNLTGTTDNETIAYLKKQQFNELLLQEIKTVLQGGEIIKFANAQAAQEQIEQDYVRLITIIERTIPQK